MLLFQMLRESQKLGDRLVKSLMSNDGRWVIRPNEVSARPIVDFLQTPDSAKTPRYSIRIVPGKGSCINRLDCCETVEVRVDGGPQWLGCVRRRRLLRAVRLFTSRYGNRVAREVSL